MDLKVRNKGFIFSRIYRFYKGESLMEKTIKYLENGEYHYATVRSVGDLAQLKTDSKETLVEAINELWNGGGNADPSKAPKPEGYDQLVQDVADAVKNQQEISQQWIEWQNEEAQLTEERKQAYLQAMKEMQEAIDKAKADAAALDDKTAKLDEQITKTFSDLDTSIQNMHEQLQKEADRMNKDLQDTKGTLSTLRTDLQNAQLDNGKIHDELTNINGKFEHKVWQTDLDPLKEQIDRAETSVQQTKDELLGKASRQDLDTVTNTVSKLDTQLKETAKGVEISVKKDELGGEIAEALTNKTNILLGTRRFTGNWWKQGEHVKFLDDPWKGFVVAEQTGDGSDTHTGITQAIDVKAGNTYVFSAYVWTKGDFGQFVPMLKLSEGDVSELSGKLDNIWLELFDVTEEPKRFSMTFTTYEDCTVYPHVSTYYFQEDSAIYSCGYQLEIGKEPTPWEPNQQDVGEYVEKTDAKFNVYNDKIQALTEKQRQQGDTQEKLRTEVTQTAEGTRQVSENLKKTNDDITKLRGEFEVRADHMKSEYETYTNKAVGQISDSTLNLIRNSSFQNKDEDFAQWQNISAKANIRQDENGLRWVELTQSGMTTNNPEGITSNYFSIKQGKVTVAVDIKSGDKASLDNDSVLSLELYNDVKKRVDFYDVSLSQLGLSKELLGDHKVHRGLYRLGIDRNDAKYMTVKAKLVKNGDLYFTNFSVRLSSIDDGAYEPNPDDINQQILKQNTKIEQNAKEVAIKANSVDVTRDIKSAVDGIKVGTSNLLHHSDTFDGWHKGASVSISNEKYLNGSVAILNNSGSGGNALDSVLDVTNDEKYITWTVYAKADNAGDKLHTELWGGGGYTDQPLTTKWQRYKFAGNHADSNHSFYLWGVNSNKGKVYVALPFAVIGNATGTWTPNAGDTSAEIKSAKDAAIKVASDQINIHVNELSTSFDDKLNKRVNEVKTASEKFTSDGIEQVVTKVTNVKNDVDRLGDTVGNLEVGGRNLLIGTSEDELSGKSYNFADYQISGGLQPNKTYTLSGWARVDQNSLNHHQNVFIDAYSEDWSWSVSLNINSSLTAQYDKITFTTPNGKQLHPYVTVYLSHPNSGTNENNNDAISGKAYIKKLKLEEGNFATDYTHAPEDINKKIDTQVLDSANIDQMKTQGHYFVHNLMGNPIGGWVYVDVMGGTDRIRQDVYQDNGSRHMYRRLFGNSWSGWEQGAYISDVNNVKTEVTASVKNLGDRVTTEVNSITTRMSDQIANAVELIQKSDFSDGSKGSWTVQSTISATNPAPPAELGISGMKVIQSNVRDSYEDVWHSVTPGEKFNVDFWCAPSGVYDSSFGLVFYDANKKLVPNNQWLGVRTDHSGQWRHYTGEITAPGNSAFARPWFQIDMPADQHNTSWLAKPHIRRQDPRVTEAIKEVNTKWDVANGQIQGKVTATDVNNILNGKDYATQSWAQTMFQMKSDSITLQAVRDNITNGIQNQVNNINNRVTNAQIGERNLAVGTNRGKAGWRVDPGNGAASTDVALLSGAKGLHISNTKKSTSWWVVSYPFDMGKLKPNTYYTISFDLQTSENTNGGAIIDLARGDSSGSPFIDGRGGNITTNGGEITHITRTLKTGGNIENNRQALYINSIALGNSNIVNIANLMIVEGTQSSVWKPAPEDQGSGQNLLRGTADFSWPTGIGMNNSFEFNYERFDDSTIAMHLWNIKSNGTGIYTKWGGAFPDGQIQVGEQYTFSFDVKGSGKFATVHNESEPEKPPITLNGVNIPNEWARVSVTGTIQALDKAFIIYFVQGADVWIKNVKIERGSIATPWTPHPFDDKDKGVNLLKSTAYWNPNDWNHLSDGKWYDDNWTDNLGHKAYGRSNAAWDGLGQTVYVTPGVYTWSAQIYLHGFEGNDSATVYYGDNQYNGTVQIQQIRKPDLNDRNKWINYSTTFYVKNAGKLCVRPELNQNHGAIHVGSQKLEHGMVATPWTPSPLDDKTATITLNSADINNMKTQGHYFVRNLANSPIAGWVYVDVTGNNNDRLKQEVYQDSGYEHRSRRWFGSGWTEWTTDVNNKNVVSQINITPDQIKIASNKIVIDGNTDIHGDLRTDRVRLVGKNGAIDMTGDTGIKLTNNDGSSMLLGRGNIDLTYKNDFRMNIDSSMITLMHRNINISQGSPIAIGNIGAMYKTGNNKRRGLSIRYNPGGDNEQLHGADFLDIGFNDPNKLGNIINQLEFTSKDMQLGETRKRKGINFLDNINLQGYQIINVGDNDQESDGRWSNDPLMIHRSQWDKSSQSNRYQPTIRLGYDPNNKASAGVTFLWDQVKPFGNRDISDLGEIWFNGIKFIFGWVNNPDMMGNQWQPSFYRVGDDGSVTSGIAFAPGSTWDLGSNQAHNITAKLIWG